MHIHYWRVFLVPLKCSAWGRCFICFTLVPALFQRNRNNFTCVYYFTSAVKTKYHKLAGWNEIYCITVLEAVSPRSRCGQAWFLLRAVLQTLFHVSLLASCGLLESLVLFGLQMHDPNTCFQDFMVFSLCPCLSPHFPFFKDTGHIGLGAHPTPIWPHLILISYICNHPIPK